MLVKSRKRNFPKKYKKLSNLKNKNKIQKQKIKRLLLSMKKSLNKLKNK